MPWGRLDDGLYDHPKLDKLGDSKLPAVGLWTLSISWSNRRLTDGFIPAGRVIALGGTEELARALVGAEMFDLADGGYRVHDFLTFNESRAQVELRREADRMRKRPPVGVRPASAGKPDGNQPESDGNQSGVQPDAVGTPEDPPARAGPRPVPASPVLDSPQPPASGGLRANGTNPRAVAASAQEEAEDQATGRRYRRSQRQLAELRHSITTEQETDMNRRDAPLSEIPDWAEHVASLQPREWSI